ncbi:Hypothetical_protein [Hexamita inflata]|uniref:Hypothetical_protein n=1 Tax=Hexamita inflata TaxID=28002 RepID=A0AA86N876_9EUKA|nr:Hypothetical protein HINF_LOCUS2198 [Hexamita inflata]
MTFQSNVKPNCKKPREKIFKNALNSPINQQLSFIDIDDEQLQKLNLLKQTDTLEDLFSNTYKFYVISTQQCSQIQEALQFKCICSKIQFMNANVPNSLGFAEIPDFLQILDYQFGNQTVTQWYAVK